MNTQPRVLKWSLIIGIVIVLNLFINYAISLVYKAPDYITYCPNNQVTETISIESECVAVGGQWNGNTYYSKPIPGEVPVAGYCDPQYTCRNNYESASKIYDRNIFVALVAIGALLLLAGSIMKKNAVIASGLAMAGVLSFIIASMRYWSHADDLVHVGILAIALALLFWVAIKKFKN